MGTRDHDISWIQNQLTLAHWHLDAAVSSDAEGVRRNSKRAKHIYDNVLLAVSQLDLLGSLREEVVRSVALLRIRLEHAGELDRRTTPDR